MDNTPQKIETLRIVKSLRSKHDDAGDHVHLKPVFLLALGLAAYKIDMLHEDGETPESIDLRLGVETEELVIRQAHDLLVAVQTPYPWWKNVLCNVLGGVGTILVAGGIFAIFQYADELGVILRWGN